MGKDMRFSLTLGQVFGTAIRLHVTFVLFLLAIGGVTYAQLGAAAAVAMVVFIALVFGCVLLHEFGHILAARRYGIHTPDVILLPIGGVARMQQMPETPGREIVVALAGPAVNVAIAAVLLAGLGGLPSLTAVMEPTIAGVAGRVLYANIALVVFNMIPAFPMDGGRVLRALIAIWRGRAQATRIAALIGQSFAVLLGLFGLLGGNLLLPLVAGFIFLAAQAEKRAARLSGRAQGIRTGDAMRVDLPRLDRGATLADVAVRRLETGAPFFPVGNADGRFLGLVPWPDVPPALQARGADVPAVDLMRTELPSVRADDDLEQAARLLLERQAPAVVVVDDRDHLVGLVTRETIEDVAALRGLPQWAFRTTGAPSPLRSETA